MRTIKKFGYHVMFPHSCNLAARIKIKYLFQNLFLCKYSSYRNIYSLIIEVTRKEIKKKIMFGYGSKYLNVYFKIRAYSSQICTANDEHKMFKTINDSRNISPKEMILVFN